MSDDTQAYHMSHATEDGRRVTVEITEDILIMEDLQTRLAWLEDRVHRLAARAALARAKGEE